MVSKDIRDFRARLGRNVRVLGLDVGTKTIGLALSDLTLTIATPFDTIRRGRFAVDVETLRRTIDAQEVGGLIIGLPVGMDGTEGPRCQSVRQFAANLLAKIDIPVVFWDERLSTAAVQRLLTDEADLSRGRRAQLVDKLAAAFILQGTLDALNRPPAATAADS